MCIGSFSLHSKWIGLSKRYPNSSVLRRDVESDRLIGNGGYLRETVARGLMRQAVLAAKHCLDRGVFHRDIKSDNILVNTETLKLKLIDFGCGKLFEISDYEGNLTF